MRHNSPNGHHLRDCRFNPSDWDHVPGKGSPDKRPFQNPKPDPSPSKRAKISPKDWIQSADPKSFRTMRDTINAIGQEWETSIAAQTPALEDAAAPELVTTLTKYTAPTKSKPVVKALETTHLVPMKVRPVSTILSVTKTSPMQSHAALLNMAKSKIKSSFGVGRQHQESLSECETVRDSRFCWNGSTEATTADKQGFEFVTTKLTIDISSDTVLMAAAPLQPGCSETRATQNTSVKFLNLDDKDYVKSQVAGRVPTISMGFTDPSDPSHSDNVTRPELLGEHLSTLSESVADAYDSDFDWTSMASGITATTDWNRGLPATGLSQRIHLSNLQRYKQMIEVAMPLQNRIFMFDQYAEDEHFRIMAEEIRPPQQRHEEITHLLDESWFDGTQNAAFLSIRERHRPSASSTWTRGRRASTVHSCSSAKLYL